MIIKSYICAKLCTIGIIKHVCKNYKMLPSRHTALRQRCINVDATSRDHIDDVDMTLFQRHVPASMEKLTYYHFVQLVKMTIIMNIHIRSSA